MADNVYELELLPSNAVIANDAADIATKLIEGEIRLDYLAEMRGVTPEWAEMLIDRGVEEWWDSTDGLSSYAEVMAKRHGKPTQDEWVRTNPSRPDLSTFNGPYPGSLPLPTKLRVPDLVKALKGGRSEIYEIKPDNPEDRMGRWIPRGLSSARTKLAKIRTHFNRVGLGSAYRWGVTYPLATSGRKEVKFRSVAVRVVTYLLGLYLGGLGVSIDDITILVRRPEPAILLYKLRVRIRARKQLDWKEQWRIANFAMVVLAEVNTVGETAQVRRKQRDELARRQLRRQRDPVVAWELADLAGRQASDVQWVIDGRDWRTLPTLRIKVDADLADEIKTSIEAITTAMYSRLIGVRGERYMIVADEVWYRTNVMMPGMARIKKVMASYGVDQAALAKAQFVGLSAIFAISHAELLRLMQPEQREELAARFPTIRRMVEAAEWLLEVCKIVVPAAILTALAATGVGAPASLGLGATAGSAVLAEGAILAEGVAVVEGTAASTGALAALPGTIVESTLGVEAGLAATEGGLAGVEGGMAAANAGRTAAARSVVDQIQRLVSSPASQAEMRKFASDKFAQDLLANALKEIIQKGVAQISENASLVMACPAIAIQAVRLAIGGAVEPTPGPGTDGEPPGVPKTLHQSGPLDTRVLVDVGGVYIIKLSETGWMGDDAPRGPLPLFSPISMGPKGKFKVRKLGSFQIV